MSQADFAPYMECSLDLAVDLVNSLHPYGDHDHLADVPALEEFIEAHGVSNAPEPTKTDLREIHALRAALRDVFHAGDQAAAVEILNRLLDESAARPVLTNHDGQPWHLHYAPARSRLAPRIAAETAMALSVIIAQDGYERLRTCDGPDCEDAFVDGSRNRSRRYCSPAVCGNRASVAAYRARQRAHT
jgi:predicted RNA-binding Zn ribbon-like protein